MAQLQDKYRITMDNLDPPLVHFAIPLDAIVLHEITDERNSTDHLVLAPFTATGLLSQEVQYELRSLLAVRTHG